MLFGSYLLLLLVSFVTSTEFDLTIEIQPGRQECFWQTMDESTDVELDYQVIDGGDLDINALVVNTQNMFIHADHMKTENVIKFKTTNAGDYQFCFDNTFSRLSHKVVYFEMYISDGKDEDDEDGFDPDKLTFESEDLQDKLDMTVKDFLGIMERTKSHLERSVQVQTLIRVHEAKDRNIQENNFYRVNFFSSVQLIVMLGVALVQVLMIRSLFNDKASTKGTSLKAKT